MSTLQVDDTQPGVGDSNCGVGVDTLVVRAPVDKKLDHSHQETFVTLAKVSRYAAHRATPAADVVSNLRSSRKPSDPGDSARASLPTATICSSPLTSFLTG